MADGKAERSVILDAAAERIEIAARICSESQKRVVQSTGRLFHNREITARSLALLVRAENRPQPSPSGWLDRWQLEAPASGARGRRPAGAHAP